MPFCKFVILLVIQVLQKLYTKVVKYSNNIDTLQTASFKIIAVNLQNFRFLFANDVHIGLVLHFHIYFYVNFGECEPGHLQSLLLLCIYKWA